MNKIKLGEVLDVKRGTSLSGKYYSTDGDKIRLTLGNFNYPRGGFKKNISKKDIYFTGSVKSEFILKKGDIITPLTEQVSGLLGETALIPDDNLYIQSGDIGLVIPNEKKLNKEFAYYLISSPVVKKQLAAGSQQTKIRHTSPDKIKSCDVWIPDVNYQKKAGKILRTIDDKINKNNEIINILEKIANDLYNYWFLQFEFPNDDDRPYKSLGGRMIWNADLKKEIPDGWGITTVDKITLCHDSKRIPLSNSERAHKKGIFPYYGATGIMDYVKDYIFDGNYVLMAEDGSVMNPNGTPILQRITGKTWVNNHAHVLEPVNGYNCKLLMMLLKDVSVAKIKTGSIQMKINQKNMNKIIIPKIPDKLLGKINYKLDIIDKYQLQLIRENEKLSKLRDFLLPLLMNGQVGFKS